MKRSISALFLAILLHVILLLLFFAITLFVPHKPKEVPQEERRVKVSLKERPEVKKEALVKNKEVPKKALPLPKGKQLKKIIKKPLIKPKKPLELPKKRDPLKKRPINKKSVNKPIKSKPKIEPLPPKKPYVKIPKPPKESSELYAMLSKPSKYKSKETAKHDQQSKSRINQDIDELYGDVFGDLSAGEQKYILDNQEVMRRITQKVLNRVGSVNLKGDLRVNTSNIIEFYLYPNGDITDIKFINKSGYFILDHTTKETIEYAYAKYPRPDQKTLIRYKVGYYLRGY
ncbi:MAG: hypothetical protein U9P71_01010 [Campylobacterota bacterium]|nr:hypothetical protein [Campylobacterota bacterium]